MKLFKAHRDVLSIFGKRPLSYRFICNSFSLTEEEIKKLLVDLIEAGKIEKFNKGSETFYKKK